MGFGSTEKGCGALLGAPRGSRQGREGQAREHRDAAGAEEGPTLQGEVVNRVGPDVRGVTRP